MTTKYGFENAADAARVDAACGELKSADSFTNYAALAEYLRCRAQYAEFFSREERNDEMRAGQV